MQSVAESSARHNAPCKFVDNKHLPVGHDIIDVLFHNDVCFQCLIYIMVQRSVIEVGKVLYVKKSFGFFYACIRKRYRFFLFLDGIVFALF